MNIDQLKSALEAGGITAHDLEDVVEALVHDKMQNESLNGTLVRNDEKLCAKLADQVEALTQSGLQGQLEWMLDYFGNMDDLQLSLGGFLSLPVAA